METEPKIPDIECMIKWLTGAPDTPITWQCIHDQEGRAMLPIKSDLDNYTDEMETAQLQGYGVFFCPNEMDGKGRKINNVTSIRAFFVDGDNTPLPSEWLLQPTIITCRDNFHWHAYWILDEPMRTVEAFKPMQQLLIRCYNTDPAVCDPSRVMRMTGTVHQKTNDHSMYLICDGSGETYTYGQIKTAHQQAAAESPAPVAPALDISTVSAGSRHHALMATAANLRNYNHDPSVIRATLLAMRNTFDQSDRIISDEEIERIVTHTNTLEADLDIADVAEGAAIIERVQNNQAQEVEEDEELPEPTVWENPGPIPNNLLHPGGLLEEIMNFTLQQSHVRQPILAMGSALCTFGAAIQGGAKTVFGGHPSLMIVGLAPSGFGKDASLRVPQRLMKQIPQLYPALGFGDFASDAGLVTMLAMQNNCVCFVDEFGDILKYSKGVQSPTAMLASTLKRVWSCAGDEYRGKTYADAKRSIVIPNVNLNLYGATVPERYIESLSSADVKDGFVPRLLPFIVEERPDDQAPDFKTRPSKALIDGVTLWAAKKFDHIPTISYSPAAYEAAMAFRKEFAEKGREEGAKDEGSRNLYARAGEHCDRLALIHACSLDQEPTIDLRSFAWAAALTRHLIATQDYFIHNRMVDSKQHEIVLKVKDLIADAKTKGLPLSTLSRKTQGLRLSERKDAILSLLESEEIVTVIRKTKTKSANIFYLKKYAPHA